MRCQQARHRSMHPSEFVSLGIFTHNRPPLGVHIYSVCIAPAPSLSSSGQKREWPGDEVRQPVDVPRVASIDLPLSALPVGALIAHLTLPTLEDCLVCDFILLCTCVGREDWVEIIVYRQAAVGRRLLQEGSCCSTCHIEASVC